MGAWDGLKSRLEHANGDAPATGDVDGLRGVDTPGLEQGLDLVRRFRLVCPVSDQIIAAEVCRSRYLAHQKEQGGSCLDQVISCRSACDHLMHFLE